MLCTAWQGQDPNVMIPWCCVHIDLLLHAVFTLICCLIPIRDTQHGEARLLSVFVPNYILDAVRAFVSAREPRKSFLQRPVVLVHANARAPHMCQKHQRSWVGMAANSNTTCKVQDALKTSPNNQFCQKIVLSSWKLGAFTVPKPEQCKEQLKRCAQNVQKPNHLGYRTQQSIILATETICSMS